MSRTASLLLLLFLALITLAMPAVSHTQVAVGVSIRIGPPPLPVYVQPVCPAPGYIWTPGYWAYGPDGYYWVPGTWVEPPVVGVLWTPGYWAWREGFYVWSPGYWGPHVGFYGGINYGFGYTGVGFVGGYWRGGAYNYNRAVTNVNVTNIHNTYNTTVINNTTINRVSFNSGPGGITARPNAAEQSALRERHIAPTGLQMQHQQAAGSNRALLASVNHGSPAIAASPKAGVFNGHGVVAANKGGNFQKFSGNNAGQGPSHPNFSSKGNNPNSGGTFSNKGNSPNFRSSGANQGNGPNYGKGNVGVYNANKGYTNGPRVVQDIHTSNGHIQARNGGQRGNDSRSNDKRERR